MSLQHILKKLFGRLEQPKEPVAPRRDPSRVKGSSGHIKMKKSPIYPEHHRREE